MSLGRPRRMVTAGRPGSSRQQATEEEATYSEGGLLSLTYPRRLLGREQDDGRLDLR